MTESYKELEKGFTKSKKFLFALFSVLIVTGVLIVTAIVQGAAAAPVLIAGLAVIGFISTGVVLGQASLDKYVRMEALLRRPKKQGK